MKKSLYCYDTSNAIGLELFEQNNKSLKGEHKRLLGICDISLISKGSDTKRIFDLSLLVEHKADKIKLVCEYNSKLMKERKVEELFSAM